MLDYGYLAMKTRAYITTAPIVAVFTASILLCHTPVIKVLSALGIVISLLKLFLDIKSTCTPLNQIATTLEQLANKTPNAAPPENPRDHNIEQIWSSLREVRQNTNQHLQLEQVLDQLPIGIAVYEQTNLKARYTNAKMGKLLNIEQPERRSLSNILPRSEEYWEKLKNPQTLPYSEIIKMGNEKLRMETSPIYNENGTFIGPMVAWQPITKEAEIQEKFMNIMIDSLDGISEAANSIDTITQTISDEVSEGSTAVSTITRNSESKFNLIADSADELVSSLSDITTQSVNVSANIQSTINTTEKTSESINSLSQSTEKVVEIINNFFATEFSNNNQKSFRISKEISQHISNIQITSKSAKTNIQTIKSSVKEVGDATKNISESIKNQNNVTREIAKNMRSSSKQDSKINDIIEQVTLAVVKTNKSANKVSQMAAKPSHADGTAKTRIKELFQQTIQ